MLNAHLERHPPPALYTESDVFAFFIRFWRAIRKDYTFLQRGAPTEHPFADLESTFLLANRGGIFRVQSDLDVTEFKQYSAVGTGAKYALGAMRVLYDQLDDSDRDRAARRPGGRRLRRSTAAAPSTHRGHRLRKARGHGPIARALHCAAARAARARRAALSALSRGLAGVVAALVAGPRSRAAGVARATRLAGNARGFSRPGSRLPPPLSRSPSRGGF
jgi:hypothetical protein